MTEEQVIKIIEAMSGFSAINVISLCIAGVAILLTLYQLLYKPNSLKVTIGQITPKDDYYIIPITFVNSGYQTNAITHVISNTFNEDPNDKQRTKGITLSQIDAFTLKPQELTTKFLKVSYYKIGQDLHERYYKPDITLPSLKTFLGIQFSIITKSGKRISIEYLIGCFDTEFKDRKFTLKELYSIDDVSVNLLKSAALDNRKPVPLEHFKKIETPPAGLRIG